MLCNYMSKLPNKLNLENLTGVVLPPIVVDVFFNYRGDFEHVHHVRLHRVLKN